MKRTTVITITAVFAFIMISCGDENSSTDTNNWEKQDNAVNDDDAGNTGDTGNTGNTGNTGDTGDTGDTGTDMDDMDMDDNEIVTDIDETPDEDNAIDPLLAQFVGTWAQKIILKSSSTSLVGLVPSVTTRYILAEISINNKGNLKMTRKDGVMCQTDNETGTSGASKGIVRFNEPQSKFNTIYNFWSPNDIPGQKDIPQIEVKEEGGKTLFTGNKEWELRGANMDDPSKEPMVTADEDIRTFDHDVDGNSAFTIAFNGIIITGPIYFVQRLTTKYIGELVSEGKIEGNVEWTDEQYTHQDTPNGTLKGQKETTTETNNSVFQFIKVADTMTCAELISQKDTLFDVVNPNTNPDGDPNN